MNVDIASGYLYFYARLISIALNFVMIACILYKNYQVRSKSTIKTPAEVAINTLCRRVMYYTILQTISRSGYAWYEAQYGFDFSVYEAEHNQERYAALMYTAIITPTVSVGYLILFLTIEPNAYDCFKEIFCGIKNLRSMSKNDSVTNLDDGTTKNSDRISDTLSERQTDYRYNSESLYRYSWNVLRNSSFGNFLMNPSEDHDNRTESEIFAAIDEKQSLYSQRRGSNITITTINPMIRPNSKCNDNIAIQDNSSIGL